jgi:hypothetical protein
MIANVDNVIIWLQKNKLEYWQVLLKDADNSKVFESDESGFDSNAKRFRDVMELSAGSRFFIKASEKKGVNRGNFCEEFKNISESSPMKENQTPVITGVPQDEVKRQIDAAIDGFKTTLRIEALEAENKELKQTVREHDNMTTRVLGKIEPYIGTLISSVASKFLPQTTQIAMAGIDRIDDENTESTEVITSEIGNNDQERLITALGKWEKADPDFLSLIEAVATMAANNDPMYTVAKNMLKK